MTKQKTQRIQLLLPDTTVSGLNSLVEDGHFISIQEATRHFLKNGINEYTPHNQSTVNNESLNESNVAEEVSE